MKLRKRQMPNGKWIIEGRKWFWLSWHALEFMNYESRCSIERGHSARSIVSARPGTSHYMTMQKDTEAQADALLREVESTLGMVKP